MTTDSPPQRRPYWLTAVDANWFTAACPQDQSHDAEWRIHKAPPQMTDRTAYGIDDIHCRACGY